MSKRLYVGNLDYKVTDKQLKDAFKKAGKVKSAEVVVKPMGFGFVEMASEEDAQKAIDALNGQALGEREMKVDFAKSDAAGGEGAAPGGAAQAADDPVDDPVVDDPVAEETVEAPEMVGEKVEEPAE